MPCKRLRPFAQMGYNSLFGIEHPNWGIINLKCKESFSLEKYAKSASEQMKCNNFWLISCNHIVTDRHNGQEPTIGS